MTERTELLDVRKSDSERVRVHLKEYRGREYVDLRIWYISDTGEWRPSGKGLTLNPLLIPEIIRGLTLAGTAADPHGGR